MQGPGELIGQVAAQVLAPGASPEAQIEHLTKVVRVLWHEVEHLRHCISVGYNEVVIKNDAASLVMKRDGSIVLKGNHIVVEGAAVVTVKASGPLILKGATIQQN